MIFTLKDGKHFYQWDKERVLVVLDDTIDEVHFTNDAVKQAIKREVYDLDGQRLVDVPAALLQCACILTAYAYKCEGGEREYTFVHEEYRVIARKQPDDYIPDAEHDKWEELKAEVIQVLEDTKAAADRAAGSKIVSVDIINGELIITYADGDKVDLGRVNGDPGIPVTPGISPTVTTVREDNKVTVTITDVTGKHVFEIYDGKDGEGDGAGTFYAKYGETTFNEVKTAFKAGKTVICVDESGDTFYYLFSVLNSMAFFSRVMNTGAIGQVVVMSNNTWTTMNAEYAKADHNHDEYVTQEELEDAINAGGGGTGTWEDLKGKPDAFPPSEHEHDEYYPKTGGAIDGNITVKGGVVAVGEYEGDGIAKLLINAEVPEDKIETIKTLGIPAIMKDAEYGDLYITAKPTIYIESGDGMVYTNEDCAGLGTFVDSEYSVVETAVDHVILSSASESEVNTIELTPDSTAIHNLVDPVEDGDAVPKSYVDNLALGDAIKYTEQDLTEEQKAQARENIGAADAEILSPLTEMEMVVSANLYDPSLQTDDTISPHYWVNGKPYSTTQFDSTYHCTAPIPVEPNKTYTVGVITESGIVNPWHSATQGVHFYDENDNHLKTVATGTFTTPDKTAYIRMNYIHGGGVSLASLNKLCMLVLGNTLPEEYSPFGTYTTLSAVDRLKKYSPPIQYRIDNNVLKVASHYSAEKDLLVTMNMGRGNGLFDFESFKLFPRGLDIIEAENFAETILTSGTDYHAPFIVKAIENADGDDVGHSYFTGGNHQYNNTGGGSTATARSVSLRFFVDGQEVASSKGYANTIEVRWTNNVQGYNTRKADGTGREILQERHRLIFDGVEWTENIELEPLEQVLMERWYGLQFIYASVYPNYYYIGAADRTLHTNEASDCGGKDADGIVAYGEEHRIEMTIDTSVDLGKRTLSGSTGALCSNGKAYMFIIDWKEMNVGEVYRLCGGYKFMSQ